MLEQIKPLDVGLDEVDDFNRALDDGIGGIRVDTVVNIVLAGKGQIWRFKAEDGQGIIITLVDEKVDGKELFVLGLAGRSMAPHIKEIYESLAEFGKEHGCRWIVGHAKPALARVYRRQLGIEPRAVVVVKEI
jgi:hypothetical protein